ncbi:SDR family NAD(P)-dependent oxidoreductase [Jannaschia seohaensis]|uniref:NADP-dependent 3-hydroxy acid dehydrogenase YdfG n=1 Tax=Jannaschia seohaensis TaxID=475081 RepID=A0A2Y9ATM0_9RHOB|nr:SDR family NAD(P)-dependent oxidoreductase [Jannaschia seohaensis]PWJ19175.1 NADP-dependent 3-hydroxy acid dehydrogenase YdfG [Jannaschia seohaensis]SSA45837.1 NADP-dependent 3-hydroxy acid dehydrogenase YdfG [Jannaschia seohaensis]
MDRPDLALVTGASRGLGAALAEALAARGTHVVAVARTQGALEELDDRIQAAGGAATLAPMDVTDPGAMQHLCRGIHDRWGALPLWIHTAVHAPPLTPAPMISEKDMEKTVAVNIAALARLIPYVAPLLQAAGGGTAVFFDDDRPLKFAGAYMASKAAQRDLVRAWQAESTTPNAPRVHLLTPRPMATAVRARFHPGENRDALASPAEEALRLLAEIGLD